MHVYGVNYTWIDNSLTVSPVSPGIPGSPVCPGGPWGPGNPCDPGAPCMPWKKRTIWHDIAVKLRGQIWYIQWRVDLWLISLPRLPLNQFRRLLRDFLGDPATLGVQEVHWHLVVLSFPFHHCLPSNQHHPGKKMINFIVLRGTWGLLIDRQFQL